MTKLLECISINPEIRSGKPCIRCTRITVYDILEYLNEDEILEGFLNLERFSLG